MRMYLSLILALILLGLSFVPCSDSIIALDDIQHEHADHSDETHEEGCSPFCTCECCSIFVEDYHFELTIYEASFLLDLVPRETFNHYSFDYSFVFSNCIWNPPRIA